MVARVVIGLFMISDKKKGIDKARSPQWPKVRKAWLKANPECRACGSTAKVQVHHIVPFHLDESKELDENNFISLCEVPKNMFHRILVALRIRKALHPDDQGNHHLNIGHKGNFKGSNPNVINDADEHRKRLYSEPLPETDNLTVHEDHQMPPQECPKKQTKVARRKSRKV